VYRKLKIFFSGNNASKFIRIGRRRFRSSYEFNKRKSYAWILKLKGRVTLTIFVAWPFIEIERGFLK
jgi:hypothetical protein